MDSHVPMAIPEELTRLGLTINEAKAWLKTEPNFVPPDENSHERRNR